MRKQKKGSEPVKSPYRAFAFKPSKEKDADLIKFLEKQENINAYLKDLIYKDMKKK